MEIEDLKNNPEAVKQLIGLLSSLLPNESDKQDQSTESNQNSPKKQKSSVKQTNVRGRSRQSRPPHQNDFLKMSEKNMFKEDVAIDKLLSKYPPTERTRSATKLMVRCRICGKEETIHPSMLCESADRYKCNNCSTSPG